MGSYKSQTIVRDFAVHRMSCPHHLATELLYKESYTWGIAGAFRDTLLPIPGPAKYANRNIFCSIGNKDSLGDF
jgi:hypothetical protein